MPSAERPLCPSLGEGSNGIRNEVRQKPSIQQDFHPRQKCPFQSILGTWSMCGSLMDSESSICGFPSATTSWLCLPEQMAMRLGLSMARGV